MGCTSDTGCLGPKPRERQVYVDLIETIHEQVRKMNLQDDNDTYKQIKERLMKKGLLRKLIDNLVSHRANILECINQNFQIISQTSVHSIRVAGLVIMDKIMEQLQKNYKIIEQNGELETKINSVSRVSSNYRHLNEKSFHPHIDQNSNSLMGQMDHRLDLMFFKFILFLLQNEESIYTYILSSINYFATNREEKLSCKSQILRIFQILMDEIKNKKQIEASSKTISIILAKIKQNLKDFQIDQSNLIFFIEGWVSMKQKDFDDYESTINNFEEIIKLYFNRYFLNYQILFSSLLIIFDQFLFQEQKIRLILQMIIRIIKDQDIQISFMRGIFIYLLKYLTTRENLPNHSKHIFSTKQINETSYKNIFSELSKIRGFKLLTKLIIQKQIQADETIAYNSSPFLLCYITNIVFSPSQNFISELKKQFYEVVSFLNIKSNQIIINFLIEQIKEKDKNDRTRMILLNLIKAIIQIKKNITEQQSLKNINFIINIQSQYSLSMKTQILNFMKELFRHFKYGTLNHNSQVNYNLRSRICGLFYSFYQNIANNQDDYQEKNMSEKAILSNQSFSDKSSQKFLSSIRSRHDLMKQIMKFIKYFIEQNLHIFILPFLQNLADSISKMNLSKKNSEQQINVYYLIVIIQECLMMMDQKQKISDEIVQINLKLDRGTINNQIQQEMRNFVQKFCQQKIATHQIEQFEGLNRIKEGDALTINLINAVKKKIQSVKDILMLNKFQYKQIIENYKEYFANNQKSTLRSEQLSPTFEPKFFHRRSSINAFVIDANSDRSSVKMEEEQSFRDIMEKINQV